jgi:hypothetical protein
VGGRHSDIGHHQVGLAIADHREQLHTVAGLPHHFESRAVQQAGQTLAKQQIVVGYHHAHASHHLLTSPELVFLRTWRAAYDL